jgi:hypothetical protein
MSTWRGLIVGRLVGCGHVGQHACCPVNALRLGQRVKNAPQGPVLRPCPVDRSAGTLHNGRALCMTRSNLACLPSLSCSSMGRAKMLHPRTEPGTRVACVDRCALNEFCFCFDDMAATAVDGCLKRVILAHRHLVPRERSAGRQGVRSRRAHENQPVTTGYRFAERTAQCGIDPGQ